MEDGRIQRQMHGQEILINEVLIHEQLGISKEGTLDVANAIFDEAKTTLKRITSPHVFVENEQWNVVHMKEEFHAKFAAILQIFYQRKRLAYFNNKIAITFDLANRGQLGNWCFIGLTQLLVELTHWIECHKKVITNPISSKSEEDNCYLGPILDILFRKWFLLFEVPSPRIATLEEIMSPASQERQVAQ
jgi:hypothetical protein